MIDIQVTYIDQSGKIDTVETAINLDLDGARKYYIGTWFNLGDPYNPTLDRMAKAVRVDEIKENTSCPTN